MGLDYAPPYLAPTTQAEQLLQGVNYASGAAGILDESGASFVSRISSFIICVKIKRKPRKILHLYCLTE